MADELDVMVAELEAEAAKEGPLIPGKRRLARRPEGPLPKKPRASTVGGDSSARPSTTVTKPSTKAVIKQAKDKQLMETRLAGKEPGTDKGRGTIREPRESPAPKAQHSEKSSRALSGAPKVWPYAGSSRPHLGPVDSAIQAKLAVFVPRMAEQSSVGIRHKVYSS